MKSVKEFRGKPHAPETVDSGKRVKLAPMKKSGKERHAMYNDVEEDLDLMEYQTRRESALDYYDDEEEA